MKLKSLFLILITIVYSACDRETFNFGDSEIILDYSQSEISNSPSWSIKEKAPYFNLYYYFENHNINDSVIDWRIYPEEEISEDSIKKRAGEIVERISSSKRTIKIKIK